MYVHRTVEDTLIEAGKSFSCLVVYGPRQVGKSTTVEHLYGDTHKMVTLDDIEDRNLAINNPRLFLETYGWPLIIDEIQKAPNLLEEIKKKIDKQKIEWIHNNQERKLMYVLTGSECFQLQKGIAESLAGRCGVVDMTSFSQAEKSHSKGSLFKPEIDYLLAEEKKTTAKYQTRRELFEGIFQGGMPDICTGISKSDIYLKSYVNTYIEKDVRSLINASSEVQFRNFISIIALRTAQELHYDTIACDVGIDVRTCKKWISILETSGIVFLLQPYMASISKRIIKAPKLYFMDTGLCAFLCRWQDASMLEQCAMSGAFFETYVVSEIIKNAYAHNRDPKSYLFYYRDIDQKEIDLLYVEQDSLYPIEIKKGIAPNKPTKNFNVLSKYKMDIMPGLVIESCEKIRPISEKAYAYPVHLLGM